MIPNQKDDFKIIFFNRLLACQPIKPYRGWDIPMVQRLSRDLREGVFETLNDDAEFKYVRDKFMEAAPPQGPWIPRKLSDITKDIRSKYGLPSLEDENPHIKKMAEAVSKNGFPFLDRFK